MELLKKLINLIITKIYFLIFGNKPSEIAEQFVKNLFYSFFGISAAILITFGFNILAIRFLGPVEYGKLNLVVGIGEFFAIPMLFGLSIAVLRYLGAEKENRALIIGSAFRVVSVLILIFSFLFLILGDYLIAPLKIPMVLYKFAILYAFISVLFYLFQSFFQGSGQFKRLSFIWIVSALVFVIFISFYLFILKNYSFSSLFFSNMARFLVVALFGILVFRKFLLKFSLKIAKNLVHYSAYQTLSVTAGFFSLGNIDNIMLNYYLGSAFVGLYSAYYLVFNVFVDKILNTFSQVFLPAVSGISNIQVIFQKTLLFFKKIGILIFGGNFFLIWLLFKFYGKDFIFDWRLAGLMALSISLYSFLIILGNIIASTGIRGAKIGVFFAFSSAIMHVLLNIILIPRFQLLGVIISTIISTLIILIAAIYVLKFKLCKNEKG